MGITKHDVSSTSKFTWELKMKIFGDKPTSIYDAKKTKNKN